jgi:hypothetical protein
VFDGDGMVCGVLIKDGRASYSNAWVRTDRWRIEDAAGAAVLPKLGDMHGATGLGILALQHAKGCAPVGCAESNTQYSAPDHASLRRAQAACGRRGDAYGHRQHGARVSRWPAAGAERG